MPNDPGLANDTCIFMEAISGDGERTMRTMSGGSVPIIALTGPVSGADNADPGQTNPVQVRCHKKAANSNCNFPGDESVTVQLFRSQSFLWRWRLTIRQYDLGGIYWFTGTT